MGGTFRKFIKQDDGATMVEYGLMVALIAIACILVVAALGQTIAGSFDDTNTTIVNADTTAVPVTTP